MNNSMNSSGTTAAAALRGGSPLLQGCLAAGLHARRRASAQRWAMLNVLLLALLLYDLWYKCPGYTSALHAVELALAAVLGVSAVWHTVQLAPPRHRLPATARQQDLLGVHRANLESSFQLLDSSSSSRSSGECGEGAGTGGGVGEEVSALSLSQSWGGAGGSPAAAPRDPAPAPPPPDRFIADTDSLADYLSAYERARAAERAAARGAWPACAPPPAPAHYQLSAPQDSLSDGDVSGVGADAEAAGAGAGARHVWRRLDIDPQLLTTYNLNLRVWLHVTILRRLVREMASVDDALANHHLPDVKLGEVSVERLRKTAAGALARQHAPSLRGLLPFLEPFPQQRYVVQRIKELATGGALSGYRWDAGGAGWDADAGAPTDAELLLHLFLTYMDATCGAPGEENAFSSRHAGTLSARHRPTGPAILRAPGPRPPHWVLQIAGASGSGGDIVSLPPGRNNLLHSLLLLLAALRRAPLALAPHALNLLWVIGHAHQP